MEVDHHEEEDNLEDPIRDQEPTVMKSERSCWAVTEGFFSRMPQIKCHYESMTKQRYYYYYSCCILINFTLNLSTSV